MKKEVSEAFLELREYYEKLEPCSVDLETAEYYNLPHKKHPWKSREQCRSERQAYAHALNLLSDILGEPNVYCD